MTLRPLLLLGALTLLGGCDRTAEPPVQPKAKAQPQIARTGAVPEQRGGVEGATPMAERVALISLLNKRNGLVRDLEMRPGDSARIGRAIVRLRACERTPPWETPPEVGAFVQLTVQEQRDDKWYRVFSGWLFKERPDRNIVQHPIYDVFVKSCTMSFPGGEPVARPVPAAKAAPAASSAPQSPAAAAPASAPAPSPPPTPAPDTAE
jgi:hypothetical protein